MASTFAAVAIALACSGCATGHLVDRARRWERPVSYEQAAIADGRLTVAYVAAERNQFWRPLGMRRRAASVPLEQFATGLTVEELQVDWLADDAPVVGIAIRLQIEPERADEPRMFAFDAEDRPVYLHPAVLTREWIAPWVYPLLPVAAVYDAVAIPVLLLFAPAVIIPGD